MSESWAGKEVRDARATINARGWPQPCSKCGKPIVESDNWHADHYLISRHQARLMGLRLTDLPVAPAHARCNMSDGGKIGARLTNLKKTQVERPGRRASSKSRNIRGI